MSRASDGTDVLVSPIPASSSNMGSLHGSLTDIDGVGGRPTRTKEEKFDAEFTERFAQFEVLSQRWLRLPCSNRDPGSSDDSGTTRRSLDTFSSPEDEYARSVLLRFPCEQYHTGMTIRITSVWENQTCQPATNLS